MALLDHTFSYRNVLDSFYSNTRKMSRTGLSIIRIPCSVGVIKHFFPIVGDGGGLEVAH